MKEILVADVMTRNPVVISPSTNILECAKKIVTKKISSLIIVDNNKMVGFISQKDILWAITKKSLQDLSNVKAIDISPKKIAVINPHATVKEAIQKMTKLKFDRLPVVQDGMLLGIITAKDLLGVHSGVYLEIEEFRRLKEESEKFSRLKKGEKRIEGMCEECGHQGVLFRVNGMLICESCKDSM